MINQAETVIKNTDKEDIQKTILRSKIADERGYYGQFGGAYIPEMLYPNIEEITKAYYALQNDEEFKKEFQYLLRDYVGRPTPLYLAQRLSEKYGAKIYLKREDLNHTGAHKVNNTVGQVLLAKKLGKNKIVAETGAGQHGVATATVCALMGMECVVFMGEIDIARQQPNVARMKMLGAEVRPALSGSKTLKDATNEAMRYWINNPEDTHYIIGSVVGPHPYPEMVAWFQSVISEEMRNQLTEKEGTPNPDYVIACVGGGSNAAGAFYHYIDEESVQLIGAEAAGRGVSSGETAATIACGTLGVLHGSKTLLMQTIDGQVVEPYSISAGLDYPGIGALHAHLAQSKRAKFYAVTDEEAMEAGQELALLEGIIPAIETAHALSVLKNLKEDDKDFDKKIVIINLSGRGDKDLSTYSEYLNL
jgi:tryptophan synthase beta chain